MDEIIPPYGFTFDNEWVLYNKTIAIRKSDIFRLKINIINTFCGLHKHYELQILNKNKHILAIITIETSRRLIEIHGFFYKIIRDNLVS